MDEQDLSMADFPPPDEACFLLPPQLLQAESGEAPTLEAEGAEAPRDLQTAATPAGQEDGKPPSFPMVVSANFPHPGIQPLPAPSTEPSPLPQASPSGELSGPQLGSRHPTTSGVVGPSSLSPQIKKPPTGSHPDLKKEPAMRSKAASVPKEDASLPIVTPSLLQMVRLRSVDVEAHGPGVSPAGGSMAPMESGRANVAADGKTAPSAPQKPLRKSLSLRGGQPASREGLNPLHEAVRLKASTLTSREVLSVGMTERKTESRAALPGTAASNGPVSPLPKSPTSTASFIFAKSPRKLVIETAPSSKAQASLQKNLVAELMTVSSQRSTAAPGLPLQGLAKAPKAQRIPPPIAKKPSLGPGRRPCPQSPKTCGAEEPAVEKRTKKVGSESWSPPVESGDGRPPAGPEDLVRRSPRAQEAKEEGV
uniref:Uncharacterized protein n=1 Tax=Laticauda laticaudata TaxID=8630 RepID=A0A8C5RJ27_LATLA